MRVSVALASERLSTGFLLKGSKRVPLKAP